MKSYQAFLLDLDGTTYLGKQRIPSAESFIHELQARQIPFMFVTNNATKTPEQVAAKLSQENDIEVSPEQIYTSGMAMVDYLLKYFPGQKLMVIAEEALKTQLQQAGFDIVADSSAQVVVQSLSRQSTYEELAQATLAIRQGARFLVTNRDTSLPSERGMMPGSGAITAFLEAASQQSPIVMGKPFEPIMEGALRRLNLNKDQVVMVGDNYQTDIMAGINAQMDTILVLTGFTQLADLDQYEVQPTHIVEDLSHWRF
ncbi:TIGR01457 family HAD-type hydrolase [Vaginisenegalia massiliensis]|uniref:TIGR01457 family HAD-type hydrolase n=1 Tax=Vaginisenegalia massiliensis TaxID=2058294 RepID=UPI000F527806|nr:TIGR01457 family HAD-type hydrolase [Vaginisenegalia massiliensis]